jgi:hypothetical protein
VQQTQSSRQLVEQTQSSTHVWFSGSWDGNKTSHRIEWQKKDVTHYVEIIGITMFFSVQHMYIYLFQNYESSENLKCFTNV